MSSGAFPASAQAGSKADNPIPSLLGDPGCSRALLEPCNPLNICLAAVHFFSGLPAFHPRLSTETHGPYLHDAKLQARCPCPPRRIHHRLW